jgi:NarL family two-component system response regulator LiaR
MAVDNSSVVGEGAIDLRVLSTHVASVGKMIRLAIVNDYDVIVAGVASMLSQERHRIQVTALDPVEANLDTVDIVLYDTFGPVENSMDQLEKLIHRTGVPVVVYTWKLRPDVAREAIARGASGYLSKALSGPQIADAIQAIVRGTSVVSPQVEPPEPLIGGDWPGRASAGLSAREAEILTMIAAGMSNQEIADRSYLSINSVKTYIRTAYRKIGAERRSQAVRWALENGFAAVPNTTAPTEALMPLELGAVAPVPPPVPR